ncbi:hypothetical protein AB1Y20_001445 [Prymnesium parvum]|uniref:VPS9 domain-containing protein n=1 Tax=Prymnesium parvum TaxID=97485 RepID=A0AB34KDD0_PRYPA
MPPSPRKQALSTALSPARPRTSSTDSSRASSIRSRRSSAELLGWFAHQIAEGSERSSLAAWWRAGRGGRPRKRWKPLTSVTKGSPWAHILAQHHAVMSAAQTDAEWKLDASSASLLAALLSDIHPLGVLRANLLEIFQARLAERAAPSEWAAEVHALLDVLLHCTLEACGELLADDRASKARVCECVERAAFEGRPAAPPPALHLVSRCCCEARRALARCVRRGAPSGADASRARAISRRAVDESKLFYHAFAGMCAAVLEKDQACPLPPSPAAPRASPLLSPGRMIAALSRRRQAFRQRQHEWATLGPRSRRRMGRSEAAAGGSLLPARRALAGVRASVTPSAKLLCICEAVQAIASSRASADDLLQQLIWALLTSEIRSPNAEVAFVMEYAHHFVDGTGLAGYSVATFQGAVEAVCSLEIDVLLGDDVISSDQSSTPLSCCVNNDAPPQVAAEEHALALRDEDPDAFIVGASARSCNPSDGHSRLVVHSGTTLACTSAVSKRN